MNTPTLVTLFRIVALPFFFVTFYMPYTWSHGLAVSIFIMAALSDWLDGYLARSLKQHSSFGAFLDPVADKLLVVTAFILVIAKSHMILLALPVAIMIGREITVSALREWMAVSGASGLVAVSYMGKLKTTLQFLALVFLLAFVSHPKSWMFLLGTALLYIAAILTIVSMLGYFKLAWPKLLMAQKESLKESQAMLD